MTTDPTEQALLRRLQSEPGNRTKILIELATWYGRTGRHPEAIARLEELRALSEDGELTAKSLLAMGGHAEGMGDFEAAVGYYRATLAAQPRTAVVRYFANNNLGYSLNQLGRFVEGEACCRAAREVLPELPNAHKNLGLALAGQGRWREAAESYLEGTRVAPRDRRSYDLLERLLRDHPELAAEFAAAARAARDAVSGARAWTN
jgi:tetratricopeptide (TPR) repeat protein